MGRIRTIKPEILEDEPAAALSDTAWRVWVSSWLLADDGGRFRAGARFLAAEVWQDTTKTPEAAEALAELASARAKFLEVYEVDGQRYAKIKPSGWAKHQKIDHPAKSRLPDPSDIGALPVDPRELLRESREGSRGPRTSSPSRARAFRDLPEGKGIATPEDSRASTPLLLPEGSPVAARPASPSKGKAKKVPMPSGWAPNESHYQHGRDIGHDREDVEARVQAFRNWTEAGGYVYANWDRAFHSDLDRWHDREKASGIFRDALPPEPKRGPPPKVPTNEQAQAELDSLLAASRGAAMGDR